jgi:hypothetical protein
MLKDFATEELTRNCPNLDQEIVLSSEDLCGFLADAEARQTAHERQSGSVNRLSPGVRKRRRSETPDGVSSDVEASLGWHHDCERSFEAMSGRLFQFRRRLRAIVRNKERLCVFPV